MQNTSIFALMESVTRNTIANITYISEGGIPQYVLGKGNKVTKVCRMDCQLGFSYQNAVNSRLDKQGSEATFVAEPLKWGAWVNGFENKVIEHKGSLYLRYYHMRNADVTSVWLVNGAVASAEQFRKIMDYLSSKKKSSDRQAEVGLVENQVEPRAVKVENIIRLAVNGVEWSATSEVVATASR
jgi:hypothetical protein